MEAEEQGVAEGDSVDGSCTRQLMGVDYVTTKMVCLFGGPNEKQFQCIKLVEKNL